MIIDKLKGMKIAGSLQELAYLQRKHRKKYEDVPEKVNKKETSYSPPKPPVFSSKER